MQQFLLFDHFLTGLGGHNYQYAFDVMQAAEARGFQPVAAVHERCPLSPGWREAWRILPIFPDEGNYRLGLNADGRAQRPLDLSGQILPMRPGCPSPLTRWRQSWTQRWETLRHGDRPGRIARFAAACQRLLQTVAVRPRDICFFPSLSDFDFLAVMRFLRDTPATQGLVWHLQFHFDILQGREHEYAAQEQRLERLARQFAHALAQLPHHQLHFYATTQAVAAEYNRLGIGEFTWLPYPVNNQFIPLETPSGSNATSTLPLKVTCAGGLRREKGKHMLRPLLAELSGELLEKKSLQFVVQAPARRLRRIVPRHWLRPPFALSFDAQSPVASAPHPLAGDAYVQLIREAEIGLFLYDSRRYFARCSGVLVEMLACGIPVLVPAGCWLSEQLVPSQRAYLEQCWRAPELFNQQRMAWSSEPARFGRGRHPRQAIRKSPLLEVSSQTADVLLQFSLGPQAPASGFAEITVRAESPSSQPAVERATVVSWDREGQGMALLPLPEGTSRIQFTLRDPYADNSLPVSEFTWGCLPARGSLRHRPRGAVGLAFRELAEIPELLREMVAHYPAYREAARDYAVRWRGQHAATRTVEILEQFRPAEDLTGAPVKAPHFLQRRSFSTDATVTSRRRTEPSP